MALISGDALSGVVRELSRRNVKLYHACQLSDLGSYLDVGGVPSRNLLATRALPYTAFDMDARDRENGVWSLVFFNLSDFGYWFSQGKNTVPNPYGPVLLGFDPTVICQAVDVAIALKSAAAKGFDRITEGINANDLPRLFTGADGSRIRFNGDLGEEFDVPEARPPEMSCSFHDELAPLSHLVYIRVDPYTFSTGTLPDIVRRTVEEHHGSWRVFERSCSDGCETRYQILLDTIIKGVRTPRDLARAIPEGSPLASWRDQIVSGRNLPSQFKRYATYFFEGTIRHCVKGRDHGALGLSPGTGRIVSLPIW
jgi:hypothetical protein